LHQLAIVFVFERQINHCPNETIHPASLSLLSLFSVTKRAGEQKAGNNAPANERRRPQVGQIWARASSQNNTQPGNVAVPVCNSKQKVV